MSGSDRPEPADKPATNDGGKAKPVSVALVPLATSTSWSRPSLQRWSPNPSFVTHLIASAEHAPQTRRLRRATAADAQAAYRTRQAPARDVGRRMRETI